MKLLVGLGNPEDKYDNTRHNLGFEVLDHFFRKIEGGKWESQEKFKSEIVKIKELVLVKPQTYMNRSGMAVSSLASFYKVELQDIIVLHDDLDLMLGHIKVRLGGGAAGHHGVESLIGSLGTDKFIRVRLGIGTGQAFSGEHKRASFNAEHFVMEPFLPQERSKVKSMIKHAILAIETILEKGIEKAQNEFN